MGEGEGEGEVAAGAASTWTGLPVMAWPTAKERTGPTTRRRQERRGGMSCRRRGRRARSVCLGSGAERMGRNAAHAPAARRLHFRRICSLLRLLPLTPNPFCACMAFPRPSEHRPKAARAGWARAAAAAVLPSCKRIIPRMARARQAAIVGRSAGCHARCVAGPPRPRGRSGEPAMTSLPPIARAPPPPSGAAVPPACARAPPPRGIFTDALRAAPMFGGRCAVCGGGGTIKLLGSTCPFCNGNGRAVQGGRSVPQVASVPVRPIRPPTVPSVRQGVPPRHAEPPKDTRRAGLTSFPLRRPRLPAISAGCRRPCRPHAPLRHGGKLALLAVPARSELAVKANVRLEVRQALDLDGAEL